MAEFVTAAKLSDLKPGKMTAVELNENWICLANVGGTVYAVDDTCTHMQASLAGGEIVDEDGKICVMCPEHASLFELKTGEIVRAPANGPLKTYEVKVEGDEIKVSV